MPPAVGAVAGAGKVAWGGDEGGGVVVVHDGGLLATETLVMTRMMRRRRWWFAIVKVWIYRELFWFGLRGWPQCPVFCLVFLSAFNDTIDR